MKDSVILLATHFHCGDLITEFSKLRDAVGNNCFILYHQRENNIIDERILALPLFIFNRQSMRELGYPLPPLST
jgi:hypothetical protein